MSNKNNKAKEQEVPFDFITENKALNYTITVRDLDLLELKQRNLKLKEMFENLEIEHEELKKNFNIMFHDTKTVKEMHLTVEHLQNKIIKLELDIKDKEREHEDEKEKMTKSFELEIQRLKITIDTNNKKIESYNILQNNFEKQEEIIRQLHKDLEKIGKESEQRIQTNQIKHEIKFSNLKKKMQETIKEMQNNVSQLNIETMDTSSKLTLLQNHHLLIELEYQTQEIDELYQQKQALQKRVTELKYDLEVHMEVEKKLVDKNKKLKDNLNQNQNNNTEIERLTKSVIINTNSSNSNDIRVTKLEQTLKKKENEYKSLRIKYDSLIERENVNNKRYYDLFKLFEDGIKYLTENEGLRNYPEVFIDSDRIRKLDFSSLSLKEKYSILVILLNFVLKKINPEFLKLNENDETYEGNIAENNLNELKNKKIVPYWKVLNYKDVPLMNPIRRNLEGLPIISNYRYKL